MADILVNKIKTSTGKACRVNILLNVFAGNKTGSLTCMEEKRMTRVEGGGRRESMYPIYTLNETEIWRCKSFKDKTSKLSLEQVWKQLRLWFILFLLGTHVWIHLGLRRLLLVCEETTL